MIPLKYCPLCVPPTKRDISGTSRNSVRLGKIIALFAEVCWKSTAKIQIPGQSGIQIVQSSLNFEWSGFQMSFKNYTIFYGMQIFGTFQLGERVVKIDPVDKYVILFSGTGLVLIWWPKNLAIWILEYQHLEFECFR
jgi:hypothetical protein